MTVRPELFQLCWGCLLQQEIEKKLDCVQQLVSLWHRGVVRVEHDAACSDLKAAGLPAGLDLVHPSQVARRRLGTPAGRVALLHAVAHIEFSAINLALDAVYRFRNMPFEYYSDWLTVAAEECYHFTLVRHQLKKMDSDYGQLVAHNGLWEVARYSASDVLQRMALVPRVLEARGLDVTPSMIKRVDAVGDRQFADILKIIHRDEIRHVRAGSKWFHYCCTKRSLEPDATFDTILGQYKSDMNAAISGPFHRSARLNAGFSEAELEKLQKQSV